MPKISIIIPVYNAEKYIERCIISIIHQSFNDWKLILVDDGSKDHSAAIIGKYLQKDTRILYIHKENGGASSARNYGIEKATGEWLAFVDADDYLNTDYLQSLVNVQSRYNADFICGGHVKINSKGKIWKKREYPEMYFEKKDFSEMLNRGLLTLQQAPWAKLYQKSIIDKYSIRFIQGALNGEDEIFMYTYFLLCNSVAFSTSTGYNYNMIEGSLTTQGCFPYENALISTNSFTAIAEKLIKCYPTYTWINKQWTCYVDMLLNSIYKYSLTRKERIQRIKAIDLQKYVQYKKPTTFAEKILVFLLQFRMVALYDMLRNRYAK